MKARFARSRRSTGPKPGKERVLITPEGIALPVRIASRGARFGALLLDLTIIVALMIGSTMALAAIAGGLGRIMQDAEGRDGAGFAIQFLIIVWIVIMFLFRNAYFLFFELGPRGATPGKRLTGIRIAARDGGRLTADMVIARNLLRDVELFLPIVFLASAGVESGAAWLAATGWLMIFLLFPLFNRDVLRAGDVIAGSWVLESPRHKLQAAMTARSTDAAEAAPDDAPRPRYAFDEAELSVYGEYELQALERVLREGRAKAIDTVFHAISEKIGRNDGWGDERAFLDAYYTQLRARLETGMRMGRRKADKFSE